MIIDKVNKKTGHKDNFKESIVINVKFNDKSMFFPSHIQNLISRLTPTYMMVIAIAQLNWTSFDKTSQFYVHERLHETCSKYWWRNLLYINNLFGLKTMVRIHSEFSIKLHLKMHIFKIEVFNLFFLSLSLS